MSNLIPEGVQLIDFPVFGDRRGDLIVAESEKSIPFELKRVYTIFHTTFHMVRGCHAHSNMKQLIVNVTGAYTLTLDDGRVRTAIKFTEPGKGVFIDGFVWRELSEFSPGSVINCFTDKYYDDCEYISDYETFLSKVSA